MNSNDYVLKHDFGYGNNPEVQNLDKLELRNIEDTNIYIVNGIEEIFTNNLLSPLIIKIAEEYFKVFIEQIN